MPKNDGTEAQDAFVARILSQPHSWVERFRDAKDLRGINGGRAVGDFAKPSDFLVTQNGAHRYVEVKSTQNPRRFSFSQIEDGQRSMALKQAVIGGPYEFAIFSYGTGKWYIMDAATFSQAVNDNKASIKFEDLSEWL